jgi:hypothetical protein
MNPRDPNVQQLQLVAQALGPLRERLVFVGGCATGILITDDARPPVRATQDVDLIAEITTKAKLYELGSKFGVSRRSDRERHLQMAARKPESRRNALFRGSHEFLK